MTAPRHFLLAAALVGTATAGPFPPAAGQPGSDAVAGNDSRLTLWAAAVDIVRGPRLIDSPSPNPAGFGEASDAIGPAEASPDDPYTVVSLGDGGSATVTFASPIGNVPGPDFAVFENGFSAGFLELGHVEVSSDGVNFFRFPSTSLTPASANIGEGGSVNPTNVRNLAGKYLAGFGTPFDLAELRSISPGLDIQRITHIRVIDVVGTNNPLYASTDSAGGIVIDPYPTNFFTGGFDLDAVGAVAATTTTWAAWIISNGYSNDDALPTADADRNGVPNLIEYLTGNGVLKITVTPGGITLNLNRLAYRTGGNLRVEASSDLIHWSVVAESINAGPLTGSGTITESGETLKQATILLPTSPAPTFYRLAAELTPLP
jgi:hypothetical protein